MSCTSCRNPRILLGPRFLGIWPYITMCVFFKEKREHLLPKCLSLFEKELFHPAPHFLPINKSCHECFTTRCSSKKDYYFELVNESVKCVKSDLYLEKYTRHFSWTHSMSFLCNFHYLPRVTVNDQGVVAFRIYESKRNKYVATQSMIIKAGNSISSFSQRFPRLLACYCTLAEKLIAFCGYSCNNSRFSPPNTPLV